MAATVLNSEKAVAMSVYVVRAFVRLREALAANREIAAKLAELEEHLETHDGAIQEIMAVLKRLLNPRPRHQRKIGFCAPVAMDPAIEMQRSVARPRN